MAKSLSSCEISILLFIQAEYDDLVGNFSLARYLLNEGECVTKKNDNEYNFHFFVDGELQGSDFKVLYKS